MRQLSNSAEETIELGRALGRRLTPNSIVLLEGDLAAGKTTFVKGIASGVTGVAPREVNSPTFSLLQIYEGEIPLFHFDLYRLKNSQEFVTMGFEEYFDQGGICCIEWPEHITELVPKNAIRINLSHSGEEERNIELCTL